MSEDYNEFTFRLSLVYLADGNLYFTDVMADIRSIYTAEVDTISMLRTEMESRILEAIDPRGVI